MPTALIQHVGKAKLVSIVKMKMLLVCHKQENDKQRKMMKKQIKNNRSDQVQ